MMKSFFCTNFRRVSRITFLSLFLLDISLSITVAQMGKSSIPRHMPGELIIKYEPISRSLPQGREIAREHRIIASMVLEGLGLPLSEAKPIHPSLVERMKKEGTDEQAILRNASKNTKTNERFENFNFSRKLLLRFSPEIDVVDLMEKMEANEQVFQRAGFELVSISPNYLFEKQATPDDPLYKFQWAPQITQAEKIWDVTRGSSEVIIAIIDTGIDDLNPDVADKLVAGYDFVDVNLAAYEQWQRVDGEDYVNQDDDPSDTDGHGTHVAGIAAARGFDNFGITGICPDCLIMPLRAGVQFYELDEENEEDTVLSSPLISSSVSDAIFHAVENGADIINMSFGGEGRTGYQDVLQFADAAGVVLIAAAGNDDTEDAFYPAFFPEVLAVASTDDEDKKSDFSNFGTWVDVSAPGSRILSTYPEDLGASVSESLLSVNGEDFETTIFTFSGYTSMEGISGNLVYVGLARDEDLNNSSFKWDDLNGNIAYIQRGEITFREKVDRVKSRGAIGAIIFNHQDGPIFGTLGEVRDNPVPVLGLTKTDGEAILNQLNSQTQQASLRVELLSDQHTFLNGTSMAAPFVAGMAGLLLSEEPDLTPSEVKARIKASVDIIDEQNPEYIGMLGTGRVNLSTLFDTFEPPIAENTFVVYPNPSSGTFKIDFNQAGRGEVRIRVFNLIGSMIQDEIYDKQSDFWSVNIDLGTKPTGIYLVQVEHDNFKEVKKIVISR